MWSTDNCLQAHQLLNVRDSPRAWWRKEGQINKRWDFQKGKANINVMVPPVFPKNKYKVWPSLNWWPQSPSLCDLDRITQLLSTSSAIDHRQTSILSTRPDHWDPWGIFSKGEKRPAGFPPPTVWSHMKFTCFPRPFLPPCLCSFCPLCRNALSPLLYPAHFYSSYNTQLLPRT